jgi:hypothetical protein
MAAYIPYAFAALSAYSSIQSSQAEAAMLRIKANQAALEGRANALRHSQQAYQVLERQTRLGATIRAKAASGGVDPNSGSAMTLQQANAIKAGDEFLMAKQNAESAKLGGLANSQALYAAASNTEDLGVLNAITSAGMSFFMASQFTTPAGFGPASKIGGYEFSGPF